MLTQNIATFVLRAYFNGLFALKMIIYKIMKEEKLLINGNKRLVGEVSINGAKNAASGGVACAQFPAWVGGRQ